MTLKFFKVQTCIFFEEEPKYKKFGRPCGLNVNISLAYTSIITILGLVRLALILCGLSEIG
jgi:hypothetical protein